jgi:hypothetical protein
MAVFRHADFKTPQACDLRKRCTSWCQGFRRAVYARKFGVPRVRCATASRCCQHLCMVWGYVIATDLVVRGRRSGTSSIRTSAATEAPAAGRRSSCCGPHRTPRPCCPACDACSAPRSSMVVTTSQAAWSSSDEKPLTAWSGSGSRYPRISGRAHRSTALDEAAQFLSPTVANSKGSL